MCGFVGVVHWDREPVKPQELADMVRYLRHRGPDEVGTCSPVPWVGLGHARLRVIDLSRAARQPMVSDDGSVTLVYNGEIYNFRQLRAELASAGCRFVSQSDTEVILRAYEAWGVAAIKRLDGMFSLAIWDNRSKELLLARDRIGKKPLYYWMDGRCVTFGSEIKGLLPHPHVPREIDEAALPALLAFGYPPAGYTCYKDIRQLPPATLLRIGADQASGVPERYWDLGVSFARQRVHPEEEAAELRQRLTDAVQRRLIADVPLGAFLSGGVDSTIVVGLMAALMPDRPVKTFSIGFSDDASFDETRYAKTAADRFRTCHTAFVVTPASFNILERLVWHYDQPFGDSSALPTYLLAKLAREQVTVVLTGDGGDELFAGYDRFLAALWTERLPRNLLRIVARMLSMVQVGAERSMLGRAKRLTAAVHLPLPERYLRWTAAFASPFDWLLAKGRLSSDGGVSGLDPSLMHGWNRSNGQSTLSRLLHLNFDSYLPNDLLVKTDRCSMAHGLEARCPLLDTTLIQYVATLSDRCKVQGWRTKVLLKRACADLLPHRISRRRKMGFGVPIGKWFRGQWREPLQDYLSSPRALIARYVDRQRVQGLIQQHLTGRQDAGHQLWLLLTMEIWLRQMKQPLADLSQMSRTLDATDDPGSQVEVLTQ